MEVHLERCAGLDVHQGSIVACARLALPGQRVRNELATFQTHAAALRELRAWLLARGVTHVVMEATGVYWFPVYEVLEGAVDLTVANAHHVRNVPGRKTDVNDATWLAQLLAHGLLRKSFVPPAEIRRLRELTRFRVERVAARTTATNQLLKELERRGLKLASVVSDVRGQTARALLRALADEGQVTAATVAACARGKLRRKQADLVAVTAVTLDPAARWVLDARLRGLEQLDAEIAAIDAMIAGAIAPFAAQVDLVTTVTGLDVVSASALLAEIGVDMAAFVDAHHLASWAGVCPGQNISDGKSKGSKTRRGNPYLRRVLVQVAWAATRVKASYARARYHRIKARSNAGTALMAVAHKLLIGIYHVLATGKPYEDLGAAYYDTRDRERTARRLVQRLGDLGYTVTLEAPATEATPVMSLA